MNNLTFIKILRKAERIFIVILFLGILVAVIFEIRETGRVILGYGLGLFNVFLWHWWKNVGRGDIGIDKE